MFVVFDLDGTLALNDHRQHFVQVPKGEKKDWDSFFDACDKDQPNLPVIMILKDLVTMGHWVEIWSGRMGTVILKTERWLEECGLAHVPFRGRDVGDFTPDHVLKKRWLDESPVKPDVVFDDRAKVVAMWRENGVPCFQVAPGEF